MPTKKGRGNRIQSAGFCGGGNDHTMDFLDAEDGKLSEQIRVCSSVQKVDRANDTGWINLSSRTNKIILNCVCLVAVKGRKGVGQIS